MLTIESVDGKDCYVIETETAANAPMRFWLDKEKLAPVKMELETPQGTMLAVYSDPRKIQGDWEMPYLTETYMNGELLSTMTVKSVKVNTGLSDDLFNADKIEARGTGVDIRALLQKIQQKNDQ